MSGEMVVSLACRIAILFSMISFGCVVQAKSDLRVGPWGGRGGDMWTYEPKGDISHITVTYDNDIHSICFTSIDENGNLDKSRFPCKEATKTAEIDIDVKTEKLNGISGTFDSTNKCLKTVTSLSFTTNRNKTYGPFGTVKGTAFSLAVEDEGFTGFHGSTGWLLDSIGVSLGNPSSTGATEDVAPSGGPGGLPYDYMPTGELCSISIQYEGCIYSITFTSKDKDGTLSSTQIASGLPAGPDYTQVYKIDLDVHKGERLVGMSGTVGVYHTYTVVTSLKFYTNKNRSFGPFGAEDGTPFSSMVDQNKYIAGFYGRAGGLLDSIGLHVKAEPVITSGQWGNSTARRAWTYQPNGGISHISITYKDAIYSLKFTSIDGNGTPVSSKKFGKDTGSGKAEIDIDPKNEKLSGISGTVGIKKGWEVITSLTFFTDNNRTFGPFGAETGTAFSVPLKDGFISGFHGRSRKWLEAIGVYATPADI